MFAEPYIEFEDLPSTDTPIDATNLNNMQISIAEDIEEASSSGGGIIALKTITTAPSTFIEGDKYYNSTDDLIYTATSSSTWGNGETPDVVTLYLNEADNKLYRYYNNTMNLEPGGSSITVHDSYSTSTTEPYSANYVNSSNTYSTTEQRIGTWKDGKPLYKITLEYSVSTGSSSYDVSSLNIDNLAKQNHQIKRYNSSSGAADIENPFYASSTDYFRSFVRTNTNTIETRLQGNYTTYTQTTTLKYTKTTDQI